MRPTLAFTAVCTLAAFVAGVVVGLGLDTRLRFVPATITSPQATTPGSQSFTYPVLRIIDGDTFTIDYPGEGETKVRLLGVDTPERGQPGYDEATQALRRMIEGNTVTLHFDAPRRRDNFGRLLARVEVDDMDVGQVLLQEGYAAIWEGTQRPAR